MRINDGYHNNFECRQCGYCCTLSPKLTDSDIAKIKRLGYAENFFADKKEGFTRMKIIEGKCVFLTIKDGNPFCAVYDSRPLACRIYPSYDKEIKECPKRKSVIQDIAARARKELEQERAEKIKSAKGIQAQLAFLLYFISLFKLFHVLF